jgi:hypothetical protein
VDAEEEGIRKRTPVSAKGLIQKLGEVFRLRPCVIESPIRQPAAKQKPDLAMLGEVF